MLGFVAFSSCGKWGLLSSCMVSHVLASLLLSMALGVRPSVVVVHDLSCPKACGIFLYQGSNPWQVDSNPLCHQRHPELVFS